MNDEAPIQRLHGRIGGLVRANNLLRERLRKGVEVCCVCCRDLTNISAVCSGEDIWCTTCANKKDLWRSK